MLKDVHHCAREGSLIGMIRSGLLFAQFQQATQAHIVGTQGLQFAGEPLVHNHSLPSGNRFGENGSGDSTDEPDRLRAECRTGSQQTANTCSSRPSDVLRHATTR
jgi:hypothetical protein